jgi:type I restriction enzyme R subunit
MAIDRKTYRDRWQERIAALRQTDPVVRKVLAGEAITEAEWQDLAGRLNSPEFYFEEGNLRRAFEQPIGSLSDFIRAAVGLYQFPTREQRIERAFNTWIAEHSESIKPDQAHMLHLLRNIVMAAAVENQYQTLEPEVFNAPAFRRLGGLRKVEGIFGKQRLTDILDELRQLLKAA